MIIVKKSRQVLVLYFTKKKKNEIKQIELENISIFYTITDGSTCIVQMSRF